MPFVFHWPSHKINPERPACILPPVSVPACVLFKVAFYLALDMPVLFCVGRCVTCFSVHREPYPSSNRAASVVGSTADRCPDRGGGWAAD